MKTTTKKHTALTTLLILSSLITQSCSSLKKVTPEVIEAQPAPVQSEFSLMAPPPPFLMSPMYPFLTFPLMSFDHKRPSVEVRSSLPPKYENFDKKAYPNEAFIIANMIAVVQPELAPDERDTIANYISLAIKKFDIEPQIMVAIIDTESNFQNDMVSSTGDLSVAQINVDMWNKEFLRMKMPTMDKHQIKTDTQFAIMKMAEILHIIKKRNQKKDRRWYARYHSNTHTHKRDYLHKLDLRMKMLATSTNLNNQIAQVKNVKILANANSADMSIQAAQNSEVAKKLLNVIPLSTPKAETGVMLQSTPIETIETTATLLLKDLSPNSSIE